MKNIILAILFLSVFPLALSSCSSASSDNNGRIKMKATVDEIGEKILVSVLESEYTSGPHLVITSDNTEYFDKSGKKIQRSDLALGDTVTVYYNGQVMLSYPPQIVAHKIILES